jgi:protein-disulfide isomerase
VRKSVRSYFGSDTVIAIIGKHEITEHEVDGHLQHEMAQLQGRLYNLRVKAIRAIADKYLLEEAARRSHLSVETYLQRESSKDPAPREVVLRSMGLSTPGSGGLDLKLKANPESTNKEADDALKQTVVAKLRVRTPLKILMEPVRFAINTDGHPELGPRDALITIVEFSDFQCPFCKQAEATITLLRHEYMGKLRLVHFDYPLSIHANATGAAAAARCAAVQGKYWQYHNDLFEDQSRIAALDLKTRALRLGLNWPAFTDCFDRNLSLPLVDHDLIEGRKLGVRSTPTFFVNGRLIAGAQPIAEFETIIDDELSRSAKNPETGTLRDPEP